MTALKLSMQKNEKEVVPLANIFTPLPPCHPQQGELHKYYSTVWLRLASGLWTKKKGLDNRMGNILTAFLTDQLRVDSGTERRNPEYRELCEKGNKLQDQLAETLNDKQKAILEELVETLFDESGCAEQVKFERGFRLGVLITSEIFYRQDIFL